MVLIAPFFPFYRKCILNVVFISQNLRHVNITVYRVFTNRASATVSYCEADSTVRVTGDSQHIHGVITSVLIVNFTHSTF